jgi:hypothetical protein
MIYNDCVHWIAPNDPDPRMQLDRYHGYSGRAECLYVRNEFDQALSAIEGMDTSVLTDDGLRGSIAYTRAVVLLQMNRDVEAVQYLRIAAQMVGPKQETAQRILVSTLCKIGRGTDAETEYVEYIRHFHPEASQASAYRNLIVVALADEEWNNNHP